MADRRGLGMIGMIYGGVTLMITLIGSFVVTSAMSNGIERSLTVAQTLN